MARVFGMSGGMSRKGGCWFGGGLVTRCWRQIELTCSWSGPRDISSHSCWPGQFSSVVEQRFCKPSVVGSNPTTGSNSNCGCSRDFRRRESPTAREIARNPRLPKGSFNGAAPARARKCRGGSFKSVGASSTASVTFPFAARGSGTEWNPSLPCANIRVSSGKQTGASEQRTHSTFGRAGGEMEKGEWTMEKARLRTSRANSPILPPLCIVHFPFLLFGEFPAPV